MKKILFFIPLILLSVSFLHAQTLEVIKGQMLAYQRTVAKTGIDKAVKDEKFAQKPETWVLKSCIYLSLVYDASTPKELSDGIFNEAVVAFNKYKKLDPGYTLMRDTVYKGAPAALYQFSYQKGAQALSEKNFPVAFKNFEMAANYYDFLFENKLTASGMDTASVYYAGISASALNDDGNTLKYFKRLADAGFAGTGREFIYTFTTQYYMTKNDDANFKKYITLAKSRYPNNEIFSAAEVEYAQSKDEYYIKMNEGNTLLSTLYPDNKKEAPPVNTTEMESKMIAAFNRAAEIKPEKAAISYSRIGQHYYKKSLAINNQIQTINNTLNDNNKPPANIKDVDAKIRSLSRGYNSLTDLAINYFEKSAEAYEENPSLKNTDRDNYKLMVSGLITLYSQKKKITAELNPSQSEEFDVKLQKWILLYHNTFE